MGIPHVDGVRDGNLSYIVACGWSREVWIWPDQREGLDFTVAPLHAMRGHREDVTCLVRDRAKLKSPRSAGGFTEGSPFTSDKLTVTQGSVTKAGDVNLRRALCQAATVMMHRGRATWLRTWAAKLARRRGAKRAMVALARRIAVILHRMWKDDTDFRVDVPALHAS